METVKFYICRTCGNIIRVVNDQRGPLSCCGHPMEELTMNVVDASHEKHIPVYEVKSNMVNVSVGSVMHPMSEEHYIMWIYLETKNGGQIKYLNSDMDATASFILEDDKPVAIYAYCNLHELWKVECK